MMSKTLKLAALAILSAAASVAWGQTPQFNVTASVAQFCSATTAPVPFGAYDPISANNSTGTDVTATGTVTVTCTKNAGSGSSTPVTIGLSYGANATASPRKMKNTANTDTLSYDLYLPSLNGGTGQYDTCPATPNAVWGSTTSMLAPASTFWNGSAHAISVCGILPKGQPVVSAGSYQDTINVLLTF